MASFATLPSQWPEPSAALTAFYGALIFSGAGKVRGSLEVAQLSNIRFHESSTRYDPGGRRQPRAHDQHAAKGDSVLWTMHCREQSRSRAAQLAFAREVADKVEETLAATSFNKFVVAAPPRTVGDLRREFCDQVLDALSGEIEEDLVGLADSDVAAHLAHSSANTSAFSGEVDFRFVAENALDSKPGRNPI